MAKRTLYSAAIGFALLTAASGCSSSYSSGAAPDNFEPTPSPTTTAQRVIAEADIIQLDSGLLYALSSSGTVSIVNVQTPGRLTLLGQTTIAGQPFEMYRRGDFLVTMWNGAFAADGKPMQPTPKPRGATYVQPTAPDPNAGAAVIVLDVRDPRSVTRVATFPVSGEIADSRIVGDVLYLATYQNAQCYGCGALPSTLVTSFNLQDPLAMKMVDQASFASNAPDAYNLAWGSNWKRSIFVTQDRLYIGGHADIDPAQFNSPRLTVPEGIIDVLDVTDPNGRLARGARIQVAGAILSRWQLDERNGVLRVISQRGAGRTGNGIAMPEITTFTIASTQSYLPLGQTTLNLPQQEGLRTVRFDKDRAYAITYNQTDPLFTIDLSNPAAPTVRGELHMPGFMFYLEPYGDRVIGLGIDRADPKGSLNVSLFDVANLDNPKMLKRVSFGTPQVSEDYEILNNELPEDQDRIQKSFRVFADGLVAVPFTAAAGTYYGTGDTCDSLQSGVQLVDWSSDTLTARALLPVRGNPRRAFENGSELVAVSDSNVRSFSLAGTPQQTADLVIGSCTPRNVSQVYYNDWQGEYGYGQDYSRPRFLGCSAAPSASGAASPLGMLTGGLLALLLIARAARRRTA